MWNSMNRDGSTCIWYSEISFSSDWGDSCTELVTWCIHINASEVSKSHASWQADEAYVNPRLDHWTRWNDRKLLFNQTPLNVAYYRLHILTFTKFDLNLPSTLICFVHLAQSLRLERAKPCDPLDDWTRRLVSFHGLQFAQFAFAPSAFRLTDSDSCVSDVWDVAKAFIDLLCLHCHKLSL